MCLLRKRRDIETRIVSSHGPALTQLETEGSSEAGVGLGIKMAPLLFYTGNPNGSGVTPFCNRPHCTPRPRYNQLMLPFQYLLKDLKL